MHKLLVCLFISAALVSGQSLLNEFEQEQFFLFLENHRHLRATAGEAQSAYGLSGASLQAIDLAAVSAASQLNRIAESSITSQKQQADRRDALQQTAIALRGKISSHEWQALMEHIQRSVHLMRIDVDSTETEKGRSIQNTSRSSTILWLGEQLTHYNGQLYGRSDSYATGADVYSWRPYVKQHKFSKDGQQISYWPQASANPGSIAWAAGFTTPSFGSFKVESFHEFENIYTGAKLPPYSSIGNPYNAPVACTTSNGYCRLETSISATLSFTGSAEAGQPTHTVNAKGSGNVTVTANVTPSWMDPSIITWTNGTPGATNLQRLVPRSTPGDTSIRAAIGASQAGTVVVHVLDATAAPSAVNDAPKTWSLGNSIVPPNDPGLTVFGGAYGITDPTYQFTAHVSGNRWVFRLGGISHQYALGINAAWGGGPVRHDLPVGDVLPFPLAGLATTQQAYNTARDDLDTSGLVAVGPDRTRYWVRSITQNHEDEHVKRFYSSQFWLQEMNAFETFLETNPATAKDFSCFSPAWSDAATAKSRIQELVLDNEMKVRHTQADSRERPDSERETHNITNPLYVPIRSAIPSPLAPQINVGGIVPSTIRRGDSNKYLEIYGSYLNASPSVSVSGTGVTVMIDYVGKYQVNVKYSVSADAPLGQRTLTLTTAYGASSQPITVSN